MIIITVIAVTIAVRTSISTTPIRSVNLMMTSDFRYIRSIVWRFPQNSFMAHTQLINSFIPLALLQWQK